MHNTADRLASVPAPRFPRLHFHITKRVGSVVMMSPCPGCTRKRRRGEEEETKAVKKRTREEGKRDEKKEREQRGEEMGRQRGRSKKSSKAFQNSQCRTQTDTRCKSAATRVLDQRHAAAAPVNLLIVGFVQLSAATA